MSAAHGLRVDPEERGDLGDVHVAIVQHRQNLALARRQQRLGQFELADRLDRIDRELRLRHRLDRHRHRPVSAQRVARGAAGDDRDPGRQPGARRVIAAQQPEIVPAQPQKDLLGQILDLGASRATPRTAATTSPA